VADRLTVVVRLVTFSLLKAISLIVLKLRYVSGVTRDS